LQVVDAQDRRFEVNVTLFQRIQAEIFDTWLNPDADQVAEMTKSQSVLTFSLFRSEDPNEVLVQLTFPDRNTLNAYHAW
jgi:hypothetical protein